MNSSDCVPGCRFHERVRQGKWVRYRCLSPKAPEKKGGHHAPGYEIKLLKSCPEGLPEPCKRVDCGFNYQGKSCAVIPEIAEGICKTYVKRKEVESDE